MGYRVVSVILLLAIVSVFGEQAENTTTKVDVTPQKSARNLIYAELISCAVRYDTACFVNVAQDFLEIRRNELLAQADEEALRATGRADPENKPSHLAKMIEKLISDLTSMFKDNFSEYFSAKENDDELEENEKDVDTNKTSNDVGTSRSSQGEERKRGGGRRKKFGGKRKKYTKVGKQKRKKKMRHMMKYVGIGAAIIFKITFLLKLFSAHVQFKFLLLALISILMHFVKFWLDVKKGYNPPKIFYYEGGHHPHIGDDRQWDRSGESGQILAYSDEYESK